MLQVRENLQKSSQPESQSHLDQALPKQKSKSGGNMSRFKFSVGPWNVHSGADSYGPATRNEIEFEEKIRQFAKLGFSAIQFHDDDAVPNLNDLNDEEIKAEARKVKALLDQYGLKAEFVAPRLWMDPHTIDGAYMSPSKKDREYALLRSYRSIDIANELGCHMLVLWLAREGTLCAESKSPVVATKQLIDAVNKMLEYDPNIRIVIEPKPNEPVDRSICGTIGHAMAISAATIDPSRVGGNVESAHAILAGLDPSHEMGFALALGKLWTVHLNDQNGLKFDQDKSFGAENLRQAFNQIRLLVENNYGSNGEYIGLDVKAMRTTRDADSYKHLENSLKIVKSLEEKAEKFDCAFQQKCIENRDYEGLEIYTLNLLMGIEN
jgi:xylose isomerase